MATRFATSICLRALLERQERPRMPHLQLAVLEQLAHFRGELEQAQQVTHAGTGAADRFGRLLMGEPELADEALERARLFQGIEVLALDVLDERHRNGGFIGNMADDGRDLT